MEERNIPKSVSLEMELKEDSSFVCWDCGEDVPEGEKYCKECVRIANIINDIKTGLLHHPLSAEDWARCAKRWIKHLQQIKESQ